MGNTGEVRSRRTVLRGSGPLAEALATRLAAVPGGVVRGGEDVVRPGDDVVVVLNGGRFDPVPASRSAQRAADVSAQVQAVVEEVDAAVTGTADGIGDALPEPGEPGEPGEPDAPGPRPDGDVRVVVVTSAATLGARPDQEPLTDGAPLDLGVRGTIGELVELELRLREGLGRVGVTPVVLRTAALVGPDVDTMITRHFEAPRLLTVRGHERCWQFVHVDDVATAVELVLGSSGALDGDLVVGAPGALAAGDVLRLSGLRPVVLPEVTALAVAERLHRVGVLPAPSGDLAFVVHSWTVRPDRLLAAGWEPRWDNAACLELVVATVRGRVGVAGRRVGGRDAAAFGAVGAAVALGAVAVARQRRRR